MKIYAEDIEVELVRKNVKNINLSVLAPDGRVRVSAPHFVPQTEVERFVLSKLDWIRKKRETFSQIDAAHGCDFLTGDTVCLFGKPLTLILDNKAKKGSLALEGDRLIMQASGEESAFVREHYYNEWLRRMLFCEIEYLMPIWEERTSLHPSSWQIKNMSTRWGSCNTKTKKIWLSLGLAKRPPECIEYVILHELIHLREKGHGERFKALMDEYMPNWRALKQKLNKTEDAHET